MNNGAVRCGTTVCNPVSKTFTETPISIGYANLATIPAGASNISILELKNSENYLGKHHWAHVTVNNRAFSKQFIRNTKKYQNLIDFQKRLINTDIYFRKAFVTLVSDEKKFLSIMWQHPNNMNFHKIDVYHARFAMCPILNQFACIQIA